MENQSEPKAAATPAALATSANSWQTITLDKIEGLDPIDALRLLLATAVECQHVGYPVHTGSDPNVGTIILIKRHVITPQGVLIAHEAQGETAHVA